MEAPEYLSVPFDSEKAELLYKLMPALMSVNAAGYHYQRLSEARLGNSMEALFELDARITAFVVSYGRLFASSESGFTKLDAKKLFSGELSDIHDEIMRLRNERYAHHGRQSVEHVEVNLVWQDDRFVLAPKVQVQFDGRRLTEWKRVLDAVNEHLHQVFDERRALLEQEMGSQ